MHILKGRTETPAGPPIAIARSGLQSVEALAAARPRERHRAAMRLHDVLAEMQKEDRLAVLHDVNLSEGAFAQLLTDHEGLVRSVAVRIIGYSGNARLVPLLLGLIEKDPDRFVRSRAVEALGNLEAREHIPLLARIADNLTDAARYHAIRALGRLLPMSERDLLSIAFDHGEAAARRVAAETIAREADEEVWGRFIGGMSDARPLDVRLSLVEGLGKSRSARASAPIIAMLEHDPAPEVRAAAAGALSSLRDPRTLGALFESALYDPYSTPKGTPAEIAVPVGREYPVREAAAEAVLILGGESAWEELTHAVPGLVRARDVT